MRREKAMTTWQLRGRTAEELRHELQGFMERDRVQVVDLFDRRGRDMLLHAHQLIR